jgi:hypothetical protein
MNYTTANLPISCKWIVRCHVCRRSHLWNYLDWDSLTKECVVIFAQDLSGSIRAEPRAFQNITQCQKSNPLVRVSRAAARCAGCITLYKTLR